MEELARRLGNRPILLRNYLVLIPWWQASADYAEVNRILHEARTEAEILDDGWTLGLIDTYEGTTRVWQGMLTDGLAQLRGSYAASGLPLEASLRDLPPMPSVELLALAAPRVATRWRAGSPARRRKRGALRRTSCAARRRGMSHRPGRWPR